jgi:hypothetical protein
LLISPGAALLRKLEQGDTHRNVHLTGTAHTIAVTSLIELNKHLAGTTLRALPCAPVKICPGYVDTNATVGVHKFTEFWILGISSWYTPSPLKSHNFTKYGRIRVLID